MIENVPHKEIKYLPSTFKTELDFNHAKNIEKTGISVEEWILKCIDLGLQVERGKVYQEIGVKKEKVKISMENFNPYPHILGSKIYYIPQRGMAKIDNYSIKRPIIEPTKVWINRTIMMGIMLPNLSLYKKTSDEWESIKF